jgi:hypothetical protein
MHNIDLNRIEQLKEYTESTTLKFAKAQEYLARLNENIELKSGITEKLNRAIQDFPSWKINENTSTPMAQTDEEEQEPKRIFSRYDILDSLENKALSINELIEKLVELDMDE